MGMSSSQARLLTLTSRLHSIEYKAQKYEAEKLRLANDSDKVYNTYLAALDQTKLVANVLSNDGTMTYIDLTANAIYTYGTLQGQYALITKDDKALIPQSISDTYKNTDSLSAFLTAYGLDSSYTQTIHYEDPNPDYTTGESNYENAYNNYLANLEGYNRRKADYETDHAKWLSEQAAYNTDYAVYQRDLQNWQQEKTQYDTEYAEWLTKDPQPLKDDTTQDWWVQEDYSLGQDFHTAATSGSSSGGCYGAATNSNDLGCYKHVLSHIIDYSGGASASSLTYSTSLSTDASPQTFKISSVGGYCHNNTITLSDGTSSNSNVIFKDVSDQLNLGIKPSADGETCDVTSSSSDYEKLVSKWDYSTGELKTAKQWAIDLYYVAGNTSSFADYNSSTFTQTLVAFQDSLEGSLMTFDEGIYETAVTTWTNDEPPALRAKPTFNETLRTEPTFNETPPVAPNKDDYLGGINPTIPRDETVDHTTFKDKNLAQWYINLWYKMEGENEVPAIQEEIVHDDATNTNQSIYSVTNKQKSTTTYGTNDMGATENENYIIIPDNKLNDSTWVRNAIVEGYVLLQSFDSEESKFNDTSVSVDTKIDEIQDSTNLKKAEAQYEADMKKIDRKDTQYDTKIAQCETERTAIVDEIDSLKTVAKDNVERTFKLFS